jgi:hypothetical protein
MGPKSTAILPYNPKVSDTNLSDPVLWYTDTEGKMVLETIGRACIPFIPLR